MKNKILLKAIDAIIEIKDFVEQYPNTKFKIGKTDDCLRREQDYQSKGYSIFKQIADASTLDDINDLEKILIKFSRIFYNESLENERDGGGGNISKSNIYYIYLTSK